VGRFAAAAFAQSATIRHERVPGKTVFGLYPCSRCTPAVYSRIRISDIVEEKECIRVRYQPWGNQVVFIPDPERSTVKVVEAGRGEIHPEKPRTLSFAFAVLNKGNKAIVIEEDVQPILGKQPVWEERAKFSALQEK
jgi:hypothetical protein